MEIKKADRAHIDEIMSLYKDAKIFMDNHGNKDQWPVGYPSKEMITKDIDKMYLCMYENQIAAVFYYAIEEDQDYKEIEGQWLNDAPYGVVHRVVSAHIVKGACKFILNWAYSQIPNLKMDTGIKNIPMQNLLESCGFKLCGKIVNTQGITCLAYQKGETNEI